MDARRSDGEFRAFVLAQIARARAWYQLAEEGLAAIPGRRARFGVRAIGVLYGAILDELERRGGDVFAGRAHVSLVRKMTLLVAVLGGRSFARPAFFPQHAHNQRIAQLQPHRPETNR